jgi:hypothetical protein
MLVLTATTVGACARAFAPTEDPLTTWSRVPLPADARLAQATLTQSSVTAFDTGGNVVQTLTESTPGFEVKPT